METVCRSCPRRHYGLITMIRATRLFRRIDPVVVLVIVVLAFTLRLIGIVMGSPEGLNYRFEGGDAVLEYGEDGVAWLWLRGSQLSGELNLPEGDWTASVVLPPCSDGSPVQARLSLAQISIAGTLGLGQRLWSAPVTFGLDSATIEVASDQRECTLANDGRSVSVGVFFERIDGPVLTPELTSSVPAEMSSDGGTWIWSTSPSLSGTTRLGPRVGSWAIDVTLPGCGQDFGPSPTEITASIGDITESRGARRDETLTFFLRPTVTQSVPFSVSVDSPPCVLPNDGREVYFFIGVRPVDPAAI